MTYLDRVLQPGENVIYQTRIHWIVYVPGILLIVVGGIGIVLGLTLPTDDLAIAGSLMTVGLLGGLLSLLASWIKRVTTEIAITDRRVIYKTGLIRRHTIEMNMNKVESVDVNQSIPGRLLDYGTIIVRGTGSGIEPLRKIEAPLKFRGFVTGQ